MTYYTMPSYTNRHKLEFVGQNKKRAIAAAKKRAVEIKQSVTIVARDGEEPGWKYIGIAEFPYILRELNLDTSDIHMNYFD